MAASLSNIVEIQSGSTSGSATPDVETYNYFQSNTKDLLKQGFTHHHMKSYSKILTEIYLRMHKMEKLGRMLVNYLDRQQKAFYDNTPKLKQSKLDEICEQMKTVEYILQEVKIKLDTDVRSQLEASIHLMKRFRSTKLIAGTSCTMKDDDTKQIQESGTHSEQEESKELSTEEEKKEHIKRMIEGMQIK